jgi:hypothetical protein
MKAQDEIERRRNARMVMAPMRPADDDQKKFLICQLNILRRNMLSLRTGDRCYRQPASARL